MDAKKAIENAVAQAVDCMETGDSVIELHSYFKGVIETYIRNLYAKIDSLKSEFQTDQSKVACIFLEDAVNKAAVDWSDEIQDAVADLLDIIQKHAGGAEKIQSAYMLFKYNGERFVESTEYSGEDEAHELHRECEVG